MIIQQEFNYLFLERRQVNILKVLVSGVAQTKYQRGKKWSKNAISLFSAAGVNYLCPLKAWSTRSRGKRTGNYCNYYLGKHSKLRWSRLRNVDYFFTLVYYNLLRSFGIFSNHGLIVCFSWDFWSLIIIRREISNVQIFFNLKIVSNYFNTLKKYTHVFLRLLNIQEFRRDLKLLFFYLLQTRLFKNYYFNRSLIKIVVIERFNEKKCVIKFLIKTKCLRIYRNMCGDWKSYEITCA